MSLGAELLGHENQKEGRAPCADEVTVVHRLSPPDEKKRCCISVLGLERVAVITSFKVSPLKVSLDAGGHFLR